MERQISMRFSQSEIYEYFKTENIVEVLKELNFTETAPLHERNSSVYIFVRDEFPFIQTIKIQVEEHGVIENKGGNHDDFLLAMSRSKRIVPQSFLFTSESWIAPHGLKKLSDSAQKYREGKVQDSEWFLINSKYNLSLKKQIEIIFEGITLEFKNKFPFNNNHYGLTQCRYIRHDEKIYQYVGVSNG